MRKFLALKFSEVLKEYRMLIITEKDVENENMDYLGSGFEILILPSKYKDVNNIYLNNIRRMIEIKKDGEVIYV